MDLESALDWVDGSEYIDGDGGYKPTFVVDTDEKAAWALRKYHAALDRVTRAEELAEIEMRRIDDWLASRRNIEGRDLDFFGGLLSRYALEQRESFDRKKIDLPDGVVQTRSTSDRFKVEDKEAFVEWAKEHAPDVLRVTYGADMSAIAEAFVMAGDAAVDDHGVVVPGITVEHGRVSASIKVN